MKRIEHAHLHIAAVTHPGLSGKNNEDNFAVSSYQVEGEVENPSVLAVVADGIGGHRAGEVASEMAVNAISHAVASSDGSQPTRVLRQAVLEASRAIASQASVAQGQQGMGATCAVAWVIGNRLYTTTVGDSRIYLLDSDGIRQISTDHTWIQEAIDKGLLSPEKARNHPNVHVIRRYLGSPEPPEADLRLRLQPGEDDSQAREHQGLRLQPDDLILLCTDGLTDLVGGEEIRQIVRKARSLEAAVQSLVDLANQRGGHDNITVVLLAVPTEKNWLENLFT
jgi:PPM family protein phosphatase